MISQNSPSPAERTSFPNLAIDALQAALDALDEGVMVCDAQGTLLVHNYAARHELVDGGVLCLSPDGMLETADGPSLLALRRALHGAASNHGHCLVPLRQRGQVLMISVQPLRVAAAAEQWTLVLTGRRGVCPELAIQHLGRMYELTPTEQSVLVSLLAGVRIADLARSRGIKLSTARSHVAAIRSKMGVQRIDDITRLVAELPPMRGALTRCQHRAVPSRLPDAKPPVKGLGSAQTARSLIPQPAPVGAREATFL